MQPLVSMRLLPGRVLIYTNKREKNGTVRAYHVPCNELLHVFLRINLYYDGNLLNLRWYQGTWYHPFHNTQFFLIVCFLRGAYLFILMHCYSLPAVTRKKKAVRVFLCAFKRPLRRLIELFSYAQKAQWGVLWAIYPMRSQAPHTRANSLSLLRIGKHDEPFYPSSSYLFFC